MGAWLGSDLNFRMKIKLLIGKLNTVTQCTVVQFELGIFDRPKLNNN